MYFRKKNYLMLQENPSFMKQIKKCDLILGKSLTYSIMHPNINYWTLSGPNATHIQQHVFGVNQEASSWVSIVNKYGYFQYVSSVIHNNWKYQFL